MKPIILKQWEARACSEGRLTQLRRPIKWPKDFPDWNGPDSPEISFCELKGFPGTFTFWEEEYPEEGGMNYTCPYGAKGDRLYGKETCVRFTGIPFKDKPWPLAPEWIMSPDRNPYESLLPVEYDNFVLQLESALACVTVPAPQTPRWASRFHWTIKDVRVERVQDITGYDLPRVGIKKGMGGFGVYERQWNKDYPKYPWDSKPWVWVLDLEKI